VLDNGNVIGLGVTPLHSGGFDGAWNVDVTRILDRGVLLAGLFAHRAFIRALPSTLSARVRVVLKLFYVVFEGHGHEFGYRTAAEVLGFVATYRTLAGSRWTFEDAIDAQIVQKLLPRLHGSRRSISGPLVAMAVLCAEPRQWADGSEIANIATIKGKAEDSATLVDDLSDAANRFSALLGQGPYKISLEKIVRMLRRLDRDGYVSFAEA